MAPNIPDPAGPRRAPGRRQRLSGRPGRREQGPEGVEQGAIPAVGGVEGGPGRRIGRDGSAAGAGASAAAATIRPDPGGDPGADRRADGAGVGDRRGSVAAPGGVGADLGPQRRLATAAEQDDRRVGAR